MKLLLARTTRKQINKYHHKFEPQYYGQMIHILSCFCSIHWYLAASHVTVCITILSRCMYHFQLKKYISITPPPSLYVHHPHKLFIHEQGMVLVT
jgi:hypothetical protein